MSGNRIQKHIIWGRDLQDQQLLTPLHYTSHL